MPPLPRVIDPTRCWIRHVTYDPAGTQVGGTQYTGQPIDGINGRQGWQACEVTTGLSDDGEATITLANTTGDDGQLHRARFRIVTDPGYRVGDEWLEIMREPHDVIAVVTPVDYTLTPDTLTIRCRTCEVLTELDYGPAFERVISSPRDLVRRAGRARIPVVLTEFTGLSGAAALPAPWTGGAAVWEPGGEGLVLANGASWAVRSVAIATTDTDWEAWANLRFTAVGTGEAAFVVMTAGNGSGTHVAADGSTIAIGFAQGAQIKSRIPGGLPGELDVRIVKDGRFLYQFVNGSLVAAGEAANVSTAPSELRLQAPPNARIVVRRAGFTTRRSLVTAGVGGDLHLPGSPTPGGLKGRYFDETSTGAAQSTDAARFAAVLSPLAEPKAERLDATIDFSGTWWPSSIPPAGFSVRWTGAIYLDLATSDRMLRLSTVDDNARVFVGKTDWPTDAAINAWTYASNTQTDKRSGGLRAHLGTQKAGWYPIIIEFAQGWGSTGNPATIQLQDSPLDGGGNPTAWATVPASRLSPFGIVDDTYRHEPRRKLLDDAAASYGIQWRTEPGTLESGRFPGRIVPYVRAGRDTDVIVDAHESVGPQVQVDASQAIDVLIADAAGIAAPSGPSQLSAQAVSPSAAVGRHMQLTAGYESLADITETALLQQRITTMLTLRDSPNEQVGVQPHGRRELADTFPLTGAALLMDWQPGDGVRIKLPDLAVDDTACRQIIRPTWQLVPGGVAALTAGFRQRPRNLKDTMRGLWRTALATQRTYQGQLSWILGTIGASSSTGPSRVALPPGALTTLVRAYVVVTSMTAAPWTLEVNGVAWGQVTGLGHYDVTSLLTLDSRTRAYARLTGGTGSYEIQLMILARA